MSVPALVNQRHPSRYLSVVSGAAYLAIQNASAGLALPVFSNTAQTMVLWNRSNSKNLALLSVTLGLVSGAAYEIGDFGFALIQGAGSTAATGLPISAAVTIATVYQMSTFNAASSADWLWCSATAIAPTIFLPIGFGSPDAYAVASTTAPPFVFWRDYDGGLIIPPGTAFCVCGMVAQAELHHVAISFEVIDID